MVPAITRSELDWSAKYELGWMKEDTSDEDEEEEQGGQKGREAPRSPGNAKSTTTFHENTTTKPASRITG